jgi:hypothetical protein
MVALAPTRPDFANLSARALAEAEATSGFGGLRVGRFLDTKGAVATMTCQESGEWVIFRCGLRGIVALVHWQA